MFSLSGFNSFGVDIVQAFNRKNPGVIQTVQRTASDILGNLAPPTTTAPNKSLFGFSFTDKILFTVFAIVIGSVAVKRLIHD